jgi:TPR repeat protein
LISALGGNSIAQNHLAYYYKNGMGINKDEKEAFKWYLKSAERGNLNAQNNLGVCYRCGIGVNKDEKKAFEWYLKSAEGGNRDAQKELGNCYYFGKGIDKDYGKAFKWYLKSTNEHDQNERNVINDLESCKKYVIPHQNNYQYIETKKYEEESKFELYLKSAEEGNGNAQVEVGKCYYFGKGIDKNLNKAFEWYLKSANKGNHIAENELGNLYYFVDKNFDKAFEFYSKSAEGGNPDGQYNLGFCYQCGIGCKRNIEKAGYWYKKASNNGSLNAKNVLDNSSLFLFMKKKSNSKSVQI